MLENEAKAVSRALETVEKALAGEDFESAVKVCGGKVYDAARDICARIVHIAEMIRDGNLGGGSGGGVSSVNARTGAVTLDKTDVGLPDAENTADLDKPMSAATKAYVDSRTYSLSSSLPLGVDPVGGDWQYPLTTQAQWSTSIGAIIPKVGDIVFYSKNTVWYAGIVLAAQLSSPWICTVRPLKGAFVQPPAADGAYTLQCVVSGGNPAFSWV